MSPIPPATTHRHCFAQYEPASLQTYLPLLQYERRLIQLFLDILSDGERCGQSSAERRTNTQAARLSPMTTAKRALPMVRGSTDLPPKIRSIPIHRPPLFRLALFRRLRPTRLINLPFENEPRPVIHSIEFRWRFPWVRLPISEKRFARNFYPTASKCGD